MLIYRYEYHLSTEEKKEETYSRIYDQNENQGRQGDASQAEDKEEMEAYRLSIKHVTRDKPS